MPRISVLTAAYNCESFVEASIQSVCEQDFTDFEFIIIDDASTDGTSTALQRAAERDQRIRLIRNEQNCGLTHSLNRALALAQGDILARHDADDISLPGRFRAQFQRLDLDRSIGVIGSEIAVEDEAGVSHGRSGICLSDGMIAWRLAISRPSFAHPSVMMRREMIQTAGGYDESYRTTQDYDLWCRLLPNTRFANLEQPLVIYRTHPASVSCKGTGAEQRVNTIRAQVNLLSGLLERPLAAQESTVLFDFVRDPAATDNARLAQAVRLMDEIIGRLTSMGRMDEASRREARREAAALLRSARPPGGVRRALSRLKKLTTTPFSGKRGI